MKIIVGLGNPGKQYSKTRHNLGFMVIDNIVSDLGMKFEKSAFGGEVCHYHHNGEKIIISKPLSFMNNSGDFVRQISSYYKVFPKNILIFHDDVDLPTGMLRLKNKGSSGGHNGILDIIQRLGSERFLRARVGISYNSKYRIVDWVLKNFSKKEMELIEEKMPKYISLAKDFFEQNYDELANKYNEK